MQGKNRHGLLQAKKLLPQDRGNDQNVDNLSNVDRSECSESSYTTMNHPELRKDTKTKAVQICNNVKPPRKGSSSPKSHQTTRGKAHQTSRFGCLIGHHG